MVVAANAYEEEVNQAGQDIAKRLERVCSFALTAEGQDTASLEIKAQSMRSRKAPALRELAEVLRLAADELDSEATLKGFYDV